MASESLEARASLSLTVAHREVEKEMVRRGAGEGGAS
jgi:hypothetical protein